MSEAGLLSMQTAGIIEYIAVGVTVTVCSAILLWIFKKSS